MINGIDVINFLVTEELTVAGATQIKVAARSDGYLVVETLCNTPGQSKGPGNTESMAELDRLKTIEAKTAKLIELLNKGEVDYDLIANLEKVING